MKNILQWIKRFFVVFGLLIISTLWISFVAAYAGYTSKSNIDISENISWQVIFFIGILVNAFLMYKLCKKLNVSFWPIPKWTRKDFKIVLLSILLTKIIVHIGLYFLYKMDINATQNDAALSTLGSVLHWTNISFYAVLVAPTMEELLFRGVIMKYWLPKQQYLGIIISAFLFGLVHTPTNWPSWFIYSGIGFVLAMIYHKTKRLDITIAIHMLHNLISFWF